MLVGMSNEILVIKYKQVTAALESEELSAVEREELKALGRVLDKLINKRLNQLEGRGIARIMAWEKANREEPTLILDMNKEVA